MKWSWLHLWRRVSHVPVAVDPPSSVYLSCNRNHRKLEINTPMVMFSGLHTRHGGCVVLMGGFRKRVNASCRMHCSLQMLCYGCVCGHACDAEMELSCVHGCLSTQLNPFGILQTQLYSYKQF